MVTKGKGYGPGIVTLGVGTVTKGMVTKGKGYWPSLSALLPNLVLWEPGAGGHAPPVTCRRFKLNYI